MDFATSDHYAVLGVDRSATEADINQAYKALARRHHPDKNPDCKAEAEVRFKRLAEAYSVLRDPEARRQYDLNGTSQSNVSYEEAERQFREWFGVDDEAEQEMQKQARRKWFGLILVALTMFAAPQLTQRLLPGMTVAVVGISLFTRGEQSQKWAWLAVFLLVLMNVGPMANRLRGGPVASPLSGAQPPSVGGAAGVGPPVVGVPHSGEVVLTEDGRFALLSDPVKQVGQQPSAGWQQRLLEDMTNAIRRGREQVVMVFSREGCPWCDRQLPVLERAIQRRAGQGQAAPGAVAPQAAAPVPAAAFSALPALLGRAAVGMGAPAGIAGRPDMLSTPLRVFIFDAGEFPQFAQTFRVEAFPTTIAWGAPGVTPMAAQGFLDDLNFDKLLQTVATATPGEAVGQGKKKRRGLFR